MTQGVLGFVCFVIALSFGLSFRTGGTPRNNILLGVKLPTGVLKKPEAMELAVRFKKANRSIFFAFIVLVLPMFKLVYPSLQLLYMTIWCTAYYIIGYQCYLHYFNRMLLMKSKKLWFPADADYHELTVGEESCEPSGRMRMLYRWLFPDRRKQLLRKAEGPLYVDEDEFWISGSYNNPRDKRKSVDKRFGIGTTANMAYKRNRRISILAFSATIVLIGSLIVLFYRMDFATFHISIGKEEISIDAPIYAYRFKTEDILEVAVTEVLPEEGIRTGGAATSTYYLGNFNLEQYGRSRVFLYIQHPPYLVIQLKDRTVLFNTKSRKETLEYYRQLVYLMEGRTG